MDEQFIQDAISNRHRLQRIINRLNYKDWRSEAKDLLNQEFNFSATDRSGMRLGGRIDVLATFNERTRLAIVEVKTVASEADLEQLFWYFDNCREIGKVDEAKLASVDFDQTLGILLAHDFLPGDYKTGARRIHLVRFRFDGKRFPFEVPAIVRQEQSEKDASGVFKHSQFNTIQDHKEYMCDGLQDAFEELCRCCLPPGDSRLNWVVQNPKSDHVAIHYKGIYILYFFVRRNWFYVGYQPREGPAVEEKVDVSEKTQARVLEKARADLSVLVARIDQQDEQRGIPSVFDWNDCEGE